ncbi:MAG: UGSC family (seleno)protein, partial [Acidimicrobiales bacterium]
PEYLPVILALLSTGESARMSSLTSMATIGIVSGPVRTEIGMNAGIGALGPFNHANATIGRAFAMGSANLQGGADPGDTYMGTLGNSYNYSAVYPENEEASPWEPLHVPLGYSPDQSVVSAFIGGWNTIQFVGPRTSRWEQIDTTALEALGGWMPPLAIMDPRVATDFSEAGYDKMKLAEWMADHSTYAADQIEVVVIGGNTSAYAKLISARRIATASVDAWR